MLPARRVATHQLSLRGVQGFPVPQATRQLAVDELLMSSVDVVPLRQRLGGVAGMKTNQLSQEDGTTMF